MRTARLVFPLCLVGWLANTMPPLEHSAECAFYKAYYLEHQRRDLAAARVLYQESLADAAQHARVGEARAALARIDATLGNPAPAPAEWLQITLDARARAWEADGARAFPAIERLEAKGDVLGALRARTRFTYAVFVRQYEQRVANFEQNIAKLRAQFATEEEAGNAGRARALATAIEQATSSMAEQRRLATCSLSVRAQEYCGRAMGSGRSLAGFCLDAVCPDPRWQDWCADLRTYLTTSAKRADLVAGQKQALEQLRDQVKELEQLVEAKDHQRAQQLADTLWHFAID